jgi:hypothetical protein
MDPATLSPLAKYVLAMMATWGSPGKSVNSREVVPECGYDKASPACELKPVCDQPSVLCAEPRWSNARGGWVKAETREAAMRRFAVGAKSLVRTATYLTRCTDERGVPDEDCKPVRWPEGPRSLASAAFAVLYWESGLREDIWEGHPPVGRGADGEGCGMQIMPNHANDVRFSQWLVRSGIVDPDSDDPEDRRIDAESAIQMMLGSDPGSLERCFETGMRILVRKRWNATYSCRGMSWSYSMFSFYGTGNKCSSRNSSFGDWAADRDKTFRKAMERWPNKIAMPQWAVAQYGQIDGYVPPKKQPGRGPYWNKPSRGGGPPLVVLKDEP